VHLNIKKIFVVKFNNKIILLENLIYSLCNIKIIYKQNMIFCLQLNFTTLRIHLQVSLNAPYIHNNNLLYLFSLNALSINANPKVYFIICFYTFSIINS